MQNWHATDDTLWSTSGRHPQLARVILQHIGRLAAFRLTGALDDPSTGLVREKVTHRSSYLLGSKLCELLANLTSTVGRLRPSAGQLQKLLRSSLLLLSLWSSGVERGSSCRIDAATALQLKFQVVKGKKEREEGESKVFFWGKQMLLVWKKTFF